MKYCSHCGAEVDDEAVVCVKCGYALKPMQVRDESNSDLLVGSKFLMLLACVVYPIAGLSCGLYLCALTIWYAGLLMGAFLCLPVAWCIPMTVSLSQKIKNNEPIGIAFKICTLIFVSRIAGILMLIHKND